MRRFHAGNPFLEQILDDWESLCKLAFKQVRLKAGESRKSVWEEPKERSAPTLVSLEDDEWLIIQVMRNKVTGDDHLDVRTFRKEKVTDKEGNTKEEFVTTNKGLNLNVAQWKQHLPKILKLLRKYE